MAKKTKEIVRVAKLEFNAGQAKPGPELAGLGIVMPEFTKQFNDETRDRNNEPVPVTITVYKDKSFDFKTHTAPASYKLKQAANVKKGSDNAKINKIATISKDQLREIATYKLPDLNTDSVDAAMKIIAGTAKNMGILIEGFDNIEAEKKMASQAAKEAKLAAAKEAQLEADEQSNIASKQEEIEPVEAVKQKDTPSEEDK